MQVKTLMLLRTSIWQHAESSKFDPENTEDCHFYVSNVYHSGKIWRQYSKWFESLVNKTKEYPDLKMLLGPDGLYTKLFRALSSLVDDEVQV